MPRTALPLSLLLLTQMMWVSPTNFGGVDEWLILELAGRGVVDVPYAQRPLGLLWALPASFLAGSLGFAAFRAASFVYSLATALLVQAIMVRLGASGRLAVLTACLTLVWGPRDLARLSTVEGAVYQGIALGTLLAIALLVEAWRRSSRALLGAGALAGFVAVRCYEGSAPLLLVGAPALMLLTQQRSPRLRRWLLAWAAGPAFGLASFLAQLALSPRSSAYQLSILGLHAEASGWLTRMAYQYSLHLKPLVGPVPPELTLTAAGMAVAAFLLVLAAPREAASAETHPRALVGAGVAGLVLAGLAYSVVVLGVTSPSPFRLQILSGPGIALALAALIEGCVLPLRGTARPIMAALLGAAVVVMGTGRTLAIQGEWNTLSFHARQTGMLRQLMGLAPDLAPHTLVVLIDGGRAWRASFGFHHAVQHLYERRAAGFVPGHRDRIYVASQGDGGVTLEPWASIRGPWRAPRDVYAYEELFVVRSAPDGALAVVESWPTEELGELPAGARYAPWSRVVRVPSRPRLVLAEP